MIAERFNDCVEPGSASLTMSLHSMEGPMLPRWIDDPTVDSAAMYSAFLSVIDSDPSIIIDSVKEDCAQLFLINHRPGPTNLPSYRGISGAVTSDAHAVARAMEAISFAGTTPLGSKPIYP